MRRTRGCRRCRRADAPRTAHRAPHAARRTPHAARRTPHAACAARRARRRPAGHNARGRCGGTRRDRAGPPDGRRHFPS
ncbi:LysR family transcriptional regulator [Burkholderia cepacia]|nr:LysR family transcriptional regulator [Burkholderia cepacia]